MKAKSVTKPRVEKDGWAYIRIKKSTRKRLQIMKAEFNLEMYNDAIAMTLNVFEKTKNEKLKQNNNHTKKD